MGSGGGQSGSSSTQATIAPELQPLFQNTANILLGLQSPELRGTEFNGQQIPSTTPLDAFLGRNAQIIPGATQGQQNILARQRERSGLPALPPSVQPPSAQEPGAPGQQAGKGGGPGGPGSTPGPAGPGVEVPSLPPGAPPPPQVPPPGPPVKTPAQISRERDERQEREARARQRARRQQRLDDE